MTTDIFLEGKLIRRDEETFQAETPSKHQPTFGLHANFPSGLWTLVLSLRFHQ
jgi:hypothetical protein